MGRGGITGVEEFLSAIVKDSRAGQSIVHTAQSTILEPSSTTEKHPHLAYAWLVVLRDNHNHACVIADDRCRSDKRTGAEDLPLTGIESPWREVSGDRQ
nr:hypothetical protein CFP56_31767 [Quercus suber]